MITKSYLRRITLTACLTCGITVVRPAIGEPLADTADVTSDTQTKSKAAARTIQVGDTLQIRMAEDRDFKFEGIVGMGGTIGVPYLEQFKVSGLTEAACSRAISRALTSELYVKADVSTIVIREATARIYIYGAVKNPGSVALEPSGKNTLSYLISGAGGLTEAAAISEALIIRKDPDTRAKTRIPFDWNAILKDIEGPKDLQLQANDVVYIPVVTGQDIEDNGLVQAAHRREVVLVGQVRKPGIIAFEKDERMTIVRAIFKAGGFTEFARIKRLRLVRYTDKDTRTETIVNGKRIVGEGHLDEDIVLQGGDVLIIDEKWINF